MISSNIVEVEIYSNAVKKSQQAGCADDLICLVTQEVAKPITYKWQFDGKEIAGETKYILSVAAFGKARM